MTKDVDAINRRFYDNSDSFFNAIPFESELPNMILKHGIKPLMLEIGSGPGALAVYLRSIGFEPTCIEPSLKLATMAEAQGLKVYPITLQEYHETTEYDCAMAISSLIHIPKADLPRQIGKIADLLKPKGTFFVSFIEGNEEGLEDPTNKGSIRFFAKWSEQDLAQLFSPHFELLETHKILNPKMDRTFILSAYRKL